MPKLTHLVLVVALILQVFWTGVAHGCQRDLPPGIAHCGVCAVSVAAHDPSDDSNDSAASDACSACHMVSLQAEFGTAVGIFVTECRAPGGLVEPVHAYHPADGPERPKWVPAA